MFVLNPVSRFVCIWFPSPYQHDTKGSVLYNLRVVFFSMGCSTWALLPRSVCAVIQYELYVILYYDVPLFFLKHRPVCNFVHCCTIIFLKEHVSSVQTFDLWNWINVVCHVMLLVSDASFLYYGYHKMLGDWFFEIVCISVCLRVRYATSC
jgi:hypothetical protein